MGQKGNKHKTSSTGKVKYGRETNTTINRNLVTYNVDFPIDGQHTDLWIYNHFPV